MIEDLIAYRKLHDAIDDDFREYELDVNPDKLTALVDAEQDRIVGSVIERLKQDKSHSFDPHVLLIVKLLDRYERQAQGWASQVAYGNGVADLAQHLERQLEQVSHYLYHMKHYLLGEHQHFKNVHELGGSFDFKGLIDKNERPPV